MGAQYYLSWVRRPSLTLPDGNAGADIGVLSSPAEFHKSLLVSF